MLTSTVEYSQSYKFEGEMDCSAGNAGNIIYSYGADCFF